ncbi:Nonribosomal siderophore peptide synthase SidC [Neofusicoccum parvum]|nr:Nonribosomal siderophore peptide synthase SidC [Neofusicoccum parvum]
MEIFVTWSSGATLCSAERQLTLSDLEGTVTATRATVMMTTPSVASLLRPDKLPTLQSLWTMGEALNRKVIDNFATADRASSNDGPRGLANAYGPTEGSINCTLFAVDPRYRGSVIGPAIPSSSLFVLDPLSKDPRPVPAGFAGELAIGGPQVSKGYLNRPAETAASFVESAQFGRLYRTGDRARIVWNEDGAVLFEFLGRISSGQVKLNGRRAELGEIEGVLAQTPEVAEAAVAVARPPGSQGSLQVVALLVLASDQHGSRVVKTCKDRAEALLPDFMRPAYYEIMSNLPRLTSAKIDRKRVAKIAEDVVSDALSREATPQAAPDLASSSGTGGELFLLVQRLVAEAVGTDPEHVHAAADLFSLGFDSLRSMALLQKLRDKCTSTISVAEVLQCRSTAGITALLAKKQAASAGAATSESVARTASTQESELRLKRFGETYKTQCADYLQIAEDEIDVLYPTTATQSGMLASFVRSMSKDSPCKTYINHSVFDIQTDTDIKRLQSAWELVLSRHEAFRTVFVPVDDDLAPFAQCVLSPQSKIAQVPWRYGNLPEVSGADLDQHVRRELRSIEDSIGLEKPPYLLSLFTSCKQTLMVVSLFHAIFDGGSFQLLLDEVDAEYRGAPAPERTSLRKTVDLHHLADHNRTAKFWSLYLEGVSPLPFPNLTGLRPEVKTRLPQTVQIYSSVPLRRLRDGAKTMGTSALAVLQTAWLVILSNYSGSTENVVFGSVISGRFDKELEVCIAPTFATVPVKSPMADAGDSSFKEISRKLALTNAESLSHLQARIGSVTTAGGQLPYDTLFAFQEFGAGGEESGIWRSIEYPPMANDFAVMVEIWPNREGSIRLKATFTDAYLNQQAATIMMREFNDILDHILANPEQPFSSASSATEPSLLSTHPVSKAELQKVASDNSLLHSQLEEHARTNPDDTALVFVTSIDQFGNLAQLSWTYAELNRRASEFAAQLRARFGDLRSIYVPICTEKSPALYVALLGILKAGGAWCPVDPFFPPRRRHDLIVRTKAPMVIVDAGKPEIEEGIPRGIRKVEIDRLGNWTDSTVASLPPEEQESGSEPVYARPEDPAYLIWTSGTTGSPKGVPIHHRAAVASMSALQRAIPGNSDGRQVRCMQFSQFTFDVFVQDLFYTWGIGGAVISSTRDVMLRSFSELATATQATHAHLTPAFAAGVERDSCPTLRVVTFIGEKLPQHVADDWRRDTIAFNTYGPAETTVVSTLQQFGGANPDVPSSNVGYALPTIGAHVIRNDAPVLRQSIGELALSGPQLSAGYLDSPDKTADRFVWSPQLNCMLYKTGDEVRELHDGSLDFVGRVDDLVKLGGIRVELSEIEFALRGCHPCVAQVAVQHINRPDRVAKVVVAFLAAPRVKASGGSLVVASPEAADVARAALDVARAELPEHMIPGVFLVVREIPRTRSAKVDRDALRVAYEIVDLTAWENAQNHPQALEVGAGGGDWSARETYVLEKIHELTGARMETMNRMSRLAALGVDSIGALRLAARLKSEGYSVSVADMISSSTVQGLVALVEKSSSELQKKSAADRLLDFHHKWEGKLRAKGLQGAFQVAPALPLQESLLSETIRSSNSYWSNHFFELEGSVEPAQLVEAWRQVVQDNDVLRTSFFPTAEFDDLLPDASTPAFLQIIHGETLVDSECVNIVRSTLIDEANKRALAIAVDRQQTGFRSPLSALTIFDDGETRNLMVTLHHAIHDGPAMQYIFSDLRRAYLKLGSTPRLQWRQALSLTRFAPDQDSQSTADFWKKELEVFSGSESRTFPDLSCRRNTANVRPEFLDYTVDLTASVSSLREFSRKLGLGSVVSVIRAAFGCTLAEYLECPSIFFGETFSDRITHPELADVVGPLISVVPVTVHATGTSREIITRQAAMVDESVKHRHVHPRTIKRLVNRQPSQPLYCAMFAYHPEAADEDDGTGKTAIWRELDELIPLTVEHPIALNVEQRGEWLSCTFSALDTLMNSDHLELFAHQVDALVNAMMQFPDLPVADLASHFPKHLLSVAEPTVTEAIIKAPELSPAHWLDRWASEHPDWVALEIASKIKESGADSQTWTYREMSAMSDRIANFLIKNGLFKRMVAVCLGRSFIAYAIVAGIWKSGNCYLPVAEDLPPERQALLLRDSRSAMLFTDKISMSSLPAVPAECRVIMVDGEDFKAQLRGDGPETFTPPQSRPDDNCYLLYTSGSTGTPKGVLVSRGNVSGFTEAQSDFICREVPDTPYLGGTGKYLAHASRAFDVHICEMVLAWRHGLALVTAPRAMLLDDLRLALCTLGVTHTGFVPSLLDQAGLEAHQVPKLRYLGVGGEKISQRIIDEFAASKSVSLVNAYGPTEATIGITSINVTPTTNVRNIGKVVGNVRPHVFQPGTFSYVKRAQAGELCVTGDLVASGYHQRPDAKGFVDFGGERMYRTGDMVRLMADGCIEFLGRSDSQAKVRGQRLELEEVSSAVAKCAGEPVDVTSLVLPSPATQRPQLIAFLSRSGHRPSKTNVAPLFVQDDYREWAPRIIAGCKKILPSYMVPSYIIPLTFIPIQISGKADVRQLRAIYEAIPRSQLLGTSSTRPETNTSVKAALQRGLTEVESRVRDILRTVVSFEVNDVGSATNILDLGIDSLNAIDLSIKLRKAGFTCSVADVLSRPLLSQLASVPFKGDNRSEEPQTQEDSCAKLAELDEAFRQQNTIGPLPNASIQAVRPTLPLQESLVASSLNDESKSLYVNHIVLKLSTTTSIAGVRDAWVDLLTDVDILRTCFAELDSTIVQLVLKPRAATLPWNEFSFRNPDEAKKSLGERQRQAAASIIETIQEQPPYRLCAAVPPDGHPRFLMISIHHSIYDAISMNLILSSLYAHYQGLTPRPQGNVEALYAHLLQHDAKAAEKFWKQSLQEFKPSHVSSNPRSDGDSLSIVELTLPKKFSALSSQASRAMATLPSLFEAVLGAMLAQLLGNADVTFGRVLAGRAIPVPSSETLIAPLVTTIPARVQFNGSKATLQDVISAVHASSMASLAHQHTPLRHIQRWVGSSIPLFDVLFSFVRVSSSQPPDHAKAWSEEEGSGGMAADYPLAVEVEADSSSDTITLRAGFTEAFGDERKARVLLENIELLLQALIEGGGPDSVQVDALRIPRGSKGALRADMQKYQWDEGVWSAEEQAIRQAVATTCGLIEKEVTKNASFFSLGVDSVTAIRFAKMLREQGLDVSSADVMKHTSIGALGDHVKSDSSANGNVDLVHLNGPATPLPANVAEADVADVYSCTPLQTSMITQTLSSAGKLYVHHHAAVISQTIQVDLLKDAWTKVVGHLDILRTSFHTAPSSRQYTAVVHHQPQPNWTVVTGVESIAQAIDDIVSRSVYPSESDFHSPPLRATLLQSNEELVLVVTLHHALYDGYSVPLIFHDLAEAYAGRALPTRAPFGSAARLIAAAQMRPSDFWSRSLTGYHKASLPTTPSSEALGRLHLVEKTLQSESQTVLRRCASLGVTLQTAALLAFGKVLARLVGQRDVAFGQVLAGRSLEVDGAENIVGPLFNTVPFRLLLDTVLKSNRHVVEDIQKFTADSQVHQHEALSEVTKAWRKETGDINPRIFDALFVFLKQDAEKTETGELFRPWKSDSDFVPDDADYPMNFEFEQSTEKIVIRASCKDAHLNQDGVSTFVRDFEEALEDIFSNPDRSAVAFPLGLRDLPITTYNDEQEQPQSYEDVHPGTDLDAIRIGLAEVTQVAEEDVELGSSVYALGLDSIAAIQVVASCRQRGVEVSVTDILQGATLGGIVRAVRQKKLPRPSESVINNVHSEPLVSQELRTSAIGLLNMDPALVEFVLPCLSGQAYHLTGWLNSGRTLFEPTWTFSCKFRVDVERLKDAWWGLRRRNSILRTCFAAVSDQDIVQVALKPEAVDRENTFRCIQASGDFQQSVIEEVKEIARNPSDLFTPPIRLCLLQHAESDRDAILLTLHHATYDAWTIPLLLSELAALYAVKPLEPPPEFSTFVEHVARTSHSPAQQEHWRKHLQTATPTIFGADRHVAKTSRPPRQLFVMAPSTVTGVASLEQRCRARAVALHSAVLLSLARALSRATGAANPTLGVYGAGRAAAFPRVDTLAGPTLVLLPLAVPGALGRPAAAAARAVQAELGARVEHEQADLRAVVGEAGGAGRFNVFANLLWQREERAAEVEAEGGEGLVLEPLRIGVPTDFAPEEAAVGKTAVDGLDCGWLRKENNVFVDVGRNAETDALDLGVRYEGEALEREDVEGFIREFAEEVRRVVDAL